MRPSNARVALTLTTVASLALGVLALTGQLSPRSNGGGRAVIASLAPAAPPNTPPDARTRTSRPPRGDPAPPAPPLAPRSPSDGRDAPDPFLLDDVGQWVLYSTQVGFLNVPVATTTDLEHWSSPVDALPELPTWATWGRTWAPGVIPRPGGFVLYFAARSTATGGQCIGAAIATTPTGPFASSSTAPLVCQPELGGSIDPHPFVHDDGSAYLTWKADGNAIGRTSQLFAQRLGHDGLTLEGHATPLLRNDAAWETPLIENPALVRLERQYVLLYSGGWWESDGYATGYATCDSPLGPCTKIMTERPLHASDHEVAGPGGACIVTGPAGDMWLAHHAWTPGMVGYGAGGARSLRFATLQWDHGRLTVGGAASH
jgi:beta-xylosidase